MTKKYYLYKMNNGTIGFIPLVILVVLLGGIYLVDSNAFKEITNVFLNQPMDFLILFLIYCLVHELFHSLAYIVHRVPFDKIIYGVALEQGVFYCLCKTNIDRNIILRSLLYPFFFLGIVTLIIGLVFNIPMLSLLSIANLSGCSGDLIMFKFIVGLPKKVKFSEMDDPISFAIYSDKDLFKTRSFGLEYIKSSNEIKREDLTKLKVSKASYIVMIACIVLYILAKIL